MGFNITLQDENGIRIDGDEDPTNILNRLLPSAEDMSSRCLRYIDWYGDTVFNQLQIVDVLDELRLLSNKVQEEDKKELLDRIVGFAEKCKNEPHLYLKFWGD